MARRRKGRPVHGWLVVDKPAGLTSSAVVNKAKWALKAQKAGHAGTLDPLATGVLALAFGEATKTVPHVTDALKTYRFTVRWGQATSTDDSAGEVLAESDLRPEPDEIRAAMAAFRGEIMQVPPQVSAVKVEGARAYDLARAGEVLDLAARPLFVERFELLGMPDRDHAEFEIICGKGGYVRAVARDLGAVLGCLGHVTALRRLTAGPFDISEAIAFDLLDELAGDPALDEHLLPVAAGLRDLPELPCTEAAAAKMRNGNPGEVLSASVEYGEEAWASCRGQPVAIGIYRAGMLHPRRVLNLGV